jgi:hypothetical protein
MAHQRSGAMRYKGDAVLFATMLEYKRDEVAASLRIHGGKE